MALWSNRCLTQFLLFKTACWLFHLTFHRAIKLTKLLGLTPNLAHQAGGEGDDRGWDGWMASRTRWTWVWVNSGSWWWTGRPGVLQFMGLQRVGHDWATELKLNWTDANGLCYLIIYLPRALSRKYVGDWLILAIGRGMGKSFLILKSIRPWEISVVDAQPQL